MSQCEQSDRLSAYHDGELDAPSRAAMDRHLASCASCAAELGRLRRLSGLLRAAAPAELSAGAMRRLHRSAELASSSTLRRWAEALTAVAAAILITFSVWLWRLPPAGATSGPMPTWETAALQHPSDSSATGAATPEEQLASWVLQDLSHEEPHGQN